MTYSDTFIPSEPLYPDLLTLYLLRTPVNTASHAIRPRFGLTALSVPYICIRSHPVTPNRDPHGYRA